MVFLSLHEDDMYHPNAHNELVPSSISNSMALIPSAQMTFQLVAAHLPIELLLMVLKEWIGAQRVVVGNIGSLDYTLSYSNPDNPSILFTIPKPLLRDYIRQRIHAWSTDTKEFDDPPTFYLSHLLTSLKMPDNRLASYDLFCHSLSLISQDPNLTLTTTFPINNIHKLRNILFPCLPPTHGFEKIKLDFTAEQYFALFDVQVPPFHYRDDTVTGDNLYRDDYCHSAGLFLAHTHALELHFGSAYKSSNPWYNVTEPAWCAPNPAWSYVEARLRPNVCNSGLVVDWILEYAWYAGYLQRIRDIKLSGDVQGWVKEKWYDIFRRHAGYVEAHPGEHVGIFAVHEPDPIELEMIGMTDDGEEDEEEDEAWMPRNHCPPPCTCEIGCWRLQNGKIEEEIKAKTWDDFEQYGTEVLGDWMVGVELGPVVD